MSHLWFLAGLISLVAAECPYGFSDQRGFSDKPLASCYKFFNGSTTWFEAATFCHTMRSHLVAFETAEEHDYIVDLIPKRGLGLRHIWVGGSDLGDEGNWIWLSSNTDFSKYNYHWDTDQPDNGARGREEHFLHLWYHTGYTWNDIPPDYVFASSDTRKAPFGFICETDAKL